MDKDDEIGIKEAILIGLMVPVIIYKALEMMRVRQSF
jgi:hypothetical protein